MIHPRNESTNRYPLFNELIPEYTFDNTLLDYGGSSGNLIYFSNGAINQSKYTCVDVVKDAISAGQSEFPDGNFIHLNKYNEMYNHDGKFAGDIWPSLSHKDFIWSYSVFSHTVIDDIIETFYWFKSLSPKKVIVSYLCNDGDDNSNKVLNYFYNKRVNKYGSCVDFRNNKEDCFYLINNEYNTGNGDEFIAVYKTEFIIENLKKHGMNATKIYASNYPIPFLNVDLGE